MINKKRAMSISSQTIMTLKLNGKEYQGTGSTLEEVLDNIKPEFYKSKGVFTITIGNKTSRPVQLLIPQLRKLFDGSSISSQIQKSVLIKKLISML